MTDDMIGENDEDAERIKNLASEFAMALMQEYFRTHPDAEPAVAMEQVVSASYQMVMAYASKFLVQSGRWTGSPVREVSTDEAQK